MERTKKRDRKRIQAETITVDEAWRKNRRVNYSPKNNMHNANTWVSIPNGTANLFILKLLSSIGISDGFENINSAIVSSWTMPTPALDNDKLVWA
jgi:hypothetical protein